MLAPHLQGMLLGNCISGVSIGLAAVMEEVTTGASSSALHVLMHSSLDAAAVP